MAASSANSNSTNAAICADVLASSTTSTFTVRDYDLAATLGCGQAFRWECHGDRWLGVIGERWVELRQRNSQIIARTAETQVEWGWLLDYLQMEVNLRQILATFPDDPPLRQAVAACRGLRLLRQPVWECLASFILSSTKQIVQIRQIIAELSRRFGTPVNVPAGEEPWFAFPTAGQLADVAESELCQCRMGFRAPYLLAAAKAVATGRLDLERLTGLTEAEARRQLLALPGVGPKIADCVLLFGCGIPSAFPVDVWVMKALRQHYFPRRRKNLASLRAFSATHFGPQGGYAQQYLFHWLRLGAGKKLSR